MPIFGALARFFGQQQKGQQQIEQLDRAIEETEKVCSKPLLDGFSGTDRFDAAQRWLDATLTQRTNGPDVGQRDEITENYLEKMHQEFEMARDELQGTTATRAEVVALGLATRELSLSFDSSLETLTRQAQEVLRTNVDRAEVRLQEQLTAWLDSQSQAIARRQQEAEQALQTKLEALVDDTARKISQRMDQTAADSRAALERELTRSQEDLRSEIAKKSQEVSARMSRRLDELREEQGAHQAKADQRLDMMANRQQNFLDEMGEAKRRAQFWIYSSAAASIGAMAVALMAIGR